MGAVSIVGSEAIDFNMNTNCSSRSLDVGKSCIIDMDFKPTSSGYKTANVMIYDDAHDSPQPIALSGIGKSGPSNCSLTGRGVEGVAAPLVAVLSVLFSVFYISRRTVMRKHQQ